MIDDQPCILAIGIDITERKQIEDKLIENQKRFSQALEATHAGVWEWDMKTGECIWSDEIWELYRLERGAAQPSFELWVSSIHPDDRSSVLQVVADSAREETEQKVEYRVNSHDGTVHWLMSSGMPLYDDKGGVVRYIGTSIDITARKFEEVERANLQAQLQQSQKMELIGQLAGGIAHDFNNVLTVILGNTELLLGKIDDTNPFTDNLENIRKSVTRSADLIRQLLSFARKQSVSPKILRLDEAAYNLQPMLRSLIPEIIQFDWRLNSNQARVCIDPSQFDQIITNLCINARDAIGGYGTITIESSIEPIEQADLTVGHLGRISDEYVRISVIDTGSGIDPEALPHIFEPFFTTKEAGKGTGLGLSTIYGIITQNNGCIDCRSNPGTGTTFNVYLRKYKDVECEEKKKESEPLIEHSREIILLVEDEPFILKILREVLEDKGHKVLSALNAEEALIIARNNMKPITLLVTDIMLPKMNGVELSEHLRASNPELKVLFMSGYTDEDINQHRNIMKHVDFIQKPFAIEDFRRAVYKTLSPL
jgi:two-component system, cell cycle sensor histidine kinase and response regulator CckA